MLNTNNFILKQNGVIQNLKERKCVKTISKLKYVNFKRVLNAIYRI